ncbi:uncharacterized protein B0J16DRAFT_325134 [Fusarium flagelliforme]|uniref:uncharacterized protein n=1 Tax=Fusarium flagelliforme TaxID=2675880 RepID=UPI001E8D93E8|nr:uncharacterized protein B0J16DRAFT_325134 [Fusarium flagelliforme]KAH7173640.1 hypothetical protein B0J16DRAFT_325134 [Fusarium flagelliforme]
MRFVCLFDKKSRSPLMISSYSKEGVSMTIQFCNSCGNLLPATQDLKTKCDCCGKVTNNTLLGISSISTTDHVPSALQNKPWINMPKNMPTSSMHKGKPIPQLPKADVKCH